jgi:hypothetical protein
MGGSRRRRGRMGSWKRGREGRGRVGGWMGEGERGRGDAESATESFVLRLLEC